MKFLYHVVIFALGVGLGIWIGVRHPEQGQQVADTEEQQVAKIQAAVSQEKIDLINHFMGQAKDNTKAEMQQMIKDEQQNLQNAKAKLGN